jgi:hypothetical protein
MKTAKDAQASRMTVEDSQASNGASVLIWDIGFDCHSVFRRPNASHQRRMEDDEANKDTRLRMMGGNRDKIGPNAIEYGKMFVIRNYESTDTHNVIAFILTLTQETQQCDSGSAS